MDFDMSMINSMTPEEAARRSEYKYNLIKKIKKEKIGRASCREV